MKQITRNRRSREGLKGRGCVSQAFTAKLMTLKYIRRRKRLSAAAIRDLEKESDRVSRRIISEILQIYGAGSKLSDV